MLAKCSIFLLPQCICFHRIQKLEFSKKNLIWENSCFKTTGFGDKYEVQLLLKQTNLLPLKVKGRRGLADCRTLCRTCFIKLLTRTGIPYFRLQFLQGNVLYVIKANLGMDLSFWTNKCLHKLCLHV